MYCRKCWEGDRMTQRNIYKNIVFVALGCILAAWLVKGISFWKHQQKTFVCTVQSGAELTEDVVKEMDKITGLYEFTPTASCTISLRLEEYTMEAVLTGINLDFYPLEWKAAETEIRKGNAPLLFFGKNAFQGFVDSNGNSPGKSQILEWIDHYQELDLVLTEEDGRVKRGKISGILEEPESGIYMDGGQMQEIYGALAKVTGGCMKIQGQRNMDKAKEILEQGGFQVEMKE